MNRQSNCNLLRHFASASNGMCFSVTNLWLGQWHSYCALCQGLGRMVNMSTLSITGQHCVRTLHHPSVEAVQFLRYMLISSVCERTFKGSFLPLDCIFNLTSKRGCSDFYVMLIGVIQFIKNGAVNCVRRIVLLLEVLFPSVFDQFWVSEHYHIFVFHCSRALNLMSSDAPNVLVH